MTAGSSHVCTRPCPPAGLLPRLTSSRVGVSSQLRPSSQAHAHRDRWHPLALPAVLPTLGRRAAELRGAWEAPGGQSPRRFEHPWAVVTGLSPPATPSSWLSRQGRGIRKNQCFQISLFS